MGISTSLALKDRFSNTLNKGAAGVDRMLKGMKQLNIQSIKMNPARAFSTFTAAANGGVIKLKEFIAKQKQSNEQTEKATHKWRGWKTAIAAVAAAAALAVIPLAKATDTYTTNSARLNLINDGLQTQAELQNKIYQAAQRSRGSYNGMVDAVAKLGLLAGDAFSGNDEMIRFSELMNKSFTISGADTSQISAGMLQLTQAMAAGRLMGDEYVSIMENAPMLIDAISKYTGKSKGELKKLSSEGYITADIIKASLFSAAGDIENKFAEMPKTFSSVWTQISNFAIMKFGGVMARINEFLNSSTGAAMIEGVTKAISFLAGAANTTLNVIQAIGDFFVNNWGVIAPILAGIGFILAGWAYTLIPALLIKLSVMLSSLWAMVAPILAQAAAWALANYPILLIGAAIALVGVLLNKLGITSDEVFGFIGGLLGGLYAYFYNIVAAIWNYWSSFVEFFANAFNHPVYSIKRLFVNLTNTILDMVIKVAEAIDKVFGSNLAGTVSSLQKQMDNWLGEMPEGYKVMKRLESKSIVDGVTGGYKAGAEFSAGLSDKIGGMFGGLGKLDGLSDSFGGGNPLTGIDVGNVANVDKVNDEIDISKESLELMKDVANMRYVQNFVTLSPTIAQNIGTVNQNADVDYIMNAAGEMLLNEVTAGAEGYYG